MVSLESTELIVFCHSSGSQYPIPGTCSSKKDPLPVGECHWREC